MLLVMKENWSFVRFLYEMHVLRFYFWPLDFQVEAQDYVDDVTAEYQRHECGVYTASTMSVAVGE